MQAELQPKTRELTATLQKFGADLGKHSLLVTSEVSKQLLLAGGLVLDCCCQEASPAGKADH